MVTRQHYQRPPVAEAVLEIRVQAPEAGAPDRLAEIQANQQNQFPTRENVYLVEGQWAFGEQVAAAARSELAGYRFRSATGNRIVTARGDLFAFSQLAPYDRWEVLRQEARSQWQVYSRLVNPVSVTRIALRYINKLYIPLPVPELSEYLTTFPQVGVQLPQELSNYVMRLELDHPRAGARLILNQAFLPQEGPETASVLLDIDLFRQTEEPLDEERLWQGLDDLHVELDRVFEGCVTDRARELFQ